MCQIKQCYLSLKANKQEPLANTNIFSSNSNKQQREESCHAIQPSPPSLQLHWVLLDLKSNRAKGLAVAAISRLSLYSQKASCKIFTAAKEWFIPAQVHDLLRGRATNSFPLLKLNISCLCAKGYVSIISDGLIFD